MARGLLITIEGIDGAGKSTLAAALADALGGGEREVVLLREPGGVPTSERIRELVKDPALEVSPRAEALLYAAARAQLVAERLAPLLDAGAVVIADRFIDSSLAYQGAGRELGIDEVRAINEFGVQGVRPDRTLLLRIDPAGGRERQGVRAEEADRLEREGDEFFARIAAAYELLAREEPARVVVIDADAPPDEVLARALDALADLISPASGVGAGGD